METKRVLYVVGRMDYGGIETMLINFFRHIDRSKIVIDFMLNYAEPGVYDDEIRRLGGKIFVLPRLLVKNTFRYIKEVNRFFKEHKEYELVHGHLTSVGVIYLTLAKLHGVKTTIVHAHATSVQGTIKGFLERLIMFPLKFCADYYFGCSNAAAAYCYGKGILSKPNYKMIKNGVVTEHFLYNPAVREAKRRELRLDEQFVIGHIGRFEEQKNHRFLIKIFRDLYSQYKDARLVLVGEGSLMQEIRGLVLEYGLDDAVLFLGGRSDVNELMQAMDVFLLPSLYEGLPVVGVEAQAAGLKCVFADTITKETDITGLCEFIPLSEPPSFWANKILRYKDGYERENTKEKIVAAGYDIASQAKWLEEFYLSKLSETNDDNRE